jgi:6-phosphogluconolactonase
LAFHPSGRFAYIINEINSTLTAARWDADQGRFDAIGTASTRPDDFPAEKNSTAEVLVHPTGRFVYGSNRGHDSIAIFRVDPQTGAVTPSGHTLTGGKTPRNFRIDPSGQFLLAQNQSTHDVHSFRIDPSSGVLSPTGSVITAKSPACIKFLP